jgi:hypothetical protein
MLTTIEHESKKLGAYSRAMLAADLTDKAADATGAGEWQKAFALLQGAVTLQPRREIARQRLADLKKRAPSNEKLSIADLDEQTVSYIQKEITRAAANQLNPREVTFKGRSRLPDVEDKFPLSLVFAAVFILVMTGFLLYEAVRGLLSGPIELCLWGLVLALTALVGGYLLMKRRLLGLMLESAVALIVFVGFWSYYTGLERQIVQVSFFFGCLPSFLLMIILAKNTGRIIRRHIQGAGGG